MKNKYIPYVYERINGSESLRRSELYFDKLNKRRSIRDFSSDPIPQGVIHNIIKTAGTAPSGAHKQPWHFCAIADADIKKQIRLAAEKEEFEFYNGRASEDWLEDLSPFGTNWEKPFLETVPWIIVVFKKAYNLDDGVKTKNYYVQESVGIATGMLISAIHEAGLATLTHTPSPMNFLSEILGRPENEKPFLLLPVGYPAKDVSVPDIQRKELHDICSFY